MTVDHVEVLASLERASSFGAKKPSTHKGGCLPHIKSCFGWLSSPVDLPLRIEATRSIDSFENLIKFLREVPFLKRSPFAAEDIPRLAMALREQIVRPGDVIVSQGNYPDDEAAFFIVYSGQVSLSWQANRNGKTRRESKNVEDTFQEKRGTLRKGDYFGGRTLIENRTYTTSAIAGVVGATILTLSRMQFQELGFHKLQFPARKEIYERNGGTPLVTAGSTVGILSLQDMAFADFQFVAKQLCKNQHLRALFSVDVIQRLAKKAKQVEVASGTTMFDEGDPVSEFYIIKAGSVAMSKGKNHEEQFDQLECTKRRLRKQAFLQKLASENLGVAGVTSPLLKSRSSCPALNMFTSDSVSEMQSRKRANTGMSFDANIGSIGSSCEESEASFDIGDEVVLVGETCASARNLGKVVQLLANECAIVDFPWKGTSVQNFCNLQRAHKTVAFSNELMGEGAVIGLIPWLYNIPRVFKCVATEHGNVIVYAISRSDFEEVLLSSGWRKDSQAKVSEWATLLGEVRVLSSLVNAEIAELARMADGEMKFEPHERVIEKGKVRELRQWYVISAGTAILSREDGTALSVIGRGGHFGERSLLRGDGIAEINVDAGEHGMVCVCINGRILENLRLCFENMGCMSSSLDDYEHLIELSSSKTHASMLVDMSTLTTQALLGNGSFGRVTLVVDDITNDKFALKRVSKRRVRQTRSQKHIRNENDLMSMVTSRFIIKLFCTYQDTQFVYMLQEAALGGTLEFMNDQYHAHKSCDIEESRLWLSSTQFFVGCVTLGLRHLHERHIVHRDLKLGNILLDEKCTPKICDFGFARFVLDKTFTVLGTPEYMAPEIIDFPHAHDEMVDYWALGTFTYELLCGTLPWECKSEEGQDLQSIRELQKAEPRPCKDAHVALIVKDFVHSLLTADPKQRLGARGFAQISSHKWFRHSFFDFEELEAGRMQAPRVPMDSMQEQPLKLAPEQMPNEYESDEVFQAVDLESWTLRNIRSENGLWSPFASEALPNLWNSYGFKSDDIGVAVTNSSKIARVTVSWNPTQCLGPVYIGLTSNPNDDISFAGGCSLCLKPCLEDCGADVSSFGVYSQDWETCRLYLQEELSITLAFEFGDFVVYRYGQQAYRMRVSSNAPLSIGAQSVEKTSMYCKVFMFGNSDCLEIVAYEECPDDGSCWDKDFKIARTDRHNINENEEPPSGRRKPKRDRHNFVSSGGAADKTATVSHLHVCPAGLSSASCTDVLASEKLSQDRESLLDSDGPIESADDADKHRDMASLLSLLFAVERKGGEGDLKKVVQAACLAVENCCSKLDLVPSETSGGKITSNPGLRGDILGFLEEDSVVDFI